ncbi:MAG: DNA gyrase subunit B, partial [Vicinamibacterales bacterium]
QPPLFRVKKGKSETYIKDERDLEAFLIRRATEARVLRVPSAGIDISGAELERLLHKMIAYQKLLTMMTRRGHAQAIVEALAAAGVDREFLSDPDRMAALAPTISSATRTATIQRDEEHNCFQLHVEDRSNGYPRQHTFGHEFVTTAEYRTLLATRREIPPLVGELIVSSEAEEESTNDDVPAQEGVGDAAAPAAPRPAVRRPGRDRAADVHLKSIDELVDYFLSAGKKGVAVNRYKGLGEMNPEQLWETTMDPKVRTLLQVRAEDHTEADLMFTTLMGDQVEPRRKFIEDNALDVKNLDV